MTEKPVFPTRAAQLDELRALCRIWLATREVSLDPLPGGFSGAPLFVVRSGPATHVLKGFAPGTTPARARFVHALMHHLRRRGLEVVPGVMEAPSGASFLADRSGTLWELQSFVAGEPAASPSSGQVRSALRVLSRLHALAAEMPENPPDVGPSPGIARRIEQARGWLARPWPALRTAADAAADRPLARLAGERLGTACDLLRAAEGQRIVAAIAALEPRPVRRQSVLRDVWSAHVLFHPVGSERVSGIIDFHAAATDTPATDVARLLGSWMTTAAAAADWWTERLGATADLPLPTGDVGLVRFLAASGILFGVDNWFRWLLEAGRTFDRPAAVATRLDWLLSMLPTALEILANHRDGFGFDR